MAAVSGRCFEVESGSGLAELRVTLSRENESRAAITDETGTFRLEAVADGLWLLSVEDCDSRRRAKHEWVAGLPVISGTPDVIVKLNRARSIAGRVTVGGRHELRGVLVSIERITPWGAHERILEPVEPSGLFDVGGLGVGAYTLRVVTLEDGNTDLCGPLRVVSGARDIEVSIP